MISQKFQAVSLSALALGLGLYLFFTRDDPSSSELAERQTHVLPTFHRAQLERVRLFQPSDKETSVVLERTRSGSDPDAFQLKGQAGAPLDTSTVEQLFSTLETETFLETLNTTLPSVTSCLERPQLVIELEFDTTAETLTICSRMPPDSPWVYARTSGTTFPDRIQKLDAKVLERLGLMPSTFLPKALFPFPRSRTSQVILSSPSRTTTLTTTPLGFRLGTDGPRAHRDRVDALFFQMARASFRTTLSETYAREILNRERSDVLEVRQIGDNGEETRVLLGTSCPTTSFEEPLVVALVEDGRERAGCIPSALRNAVRLSEDELTDRTLLPFGADELDHVVLKTSEGTIDVVRKDDGFELRTPEARTLDAELGRELFRVLTTEEGTLRPTLTLGPSTGTLRAVGHLSHLPEPIEQNVEFSRDPEGRIVVRRNDATTLELDPSFAWVFDSHATWARAREVFRLDASRYDSLDWKTPNFELHLERTGTQWSHADHKLDAALLHEMFSALQPLTVLSFTKEAHRTRMPFASLRFRTTRNEPFELLLIERVNGGYLAQATGATFLLPVETAALFLRSPLDRTPGLIELDRLERLELNAETLHRSFERRANAWRNADKEPRGLGIEALELITGLEVLEVIPKASAPTERPFLHLQGVDNAGRRLSVSFFRRSAPQSIEGRTLTQVHGQVSDTPGLFVYRAEQVGALLDAL